MTKWPDVGSSIIFFAVLLLVAIFVELDERKNKKGK